MLSLKDMSSNEIDLEEIDHIFQAVGSCPTTLKGSVKALLDATFKEEMATRQNPSETQDNILMTENYLAESDNLVAFITEQIKHQCQNLSGKQNAKRYSPLLLQLATTIYSRSPATYRQVENYLDLPSISTMAKDKASRTVNSGLSSEVYMRAAFQMLSENDRSGGVVGDEMKLKGGIWSNVTSHKIIGFANDQLNFNELVEAFSPFVKKKKVMKVSNMSYLFNAEKFTKTNKLCIK